MLKMQKSLQKSAQPDSLCVLHIVDFFCSLVFVINK